MIVRHVDMDLAQKFAISIENLNAPIAAVGHIHVAGIIGGDTVRRTELARAGSWFSPGLDPVSVFIDFGYPGIDVAVADIRIACSRPTPYRSLGETLR